MFCSIYLDGSGEWADEKPVWFFIFLRKWPRHMVTTRTGIQHDKWTPDVVGAFYLCKLVAPVSVIWSRHTVTLAKNPDTILDCVFTHTRSHFFGLMHVKRWDFTTKNIRHPTSLVYVYHATSTSRQKLNGRGPLEVRADGLEMTEKKSYQICDPKNVTSKWFLRSTKTRVCYWW